MDKIIIQEQGWLDWNEAHFMAELPRGRALICRANINCFGGIENSAYLVQYSQRNKRFFNGAV